MNMTPTTSATNSAPSRNITDVIRTVSPVSGANRVRAMYPVSTRDQAVATEHVSHVGHRGVGHGKDEVCRPQRIGVLGHAGGAYAVEQRRERATERVLVAGL